ncbi:MATE family efflux transporter [Alteromonas sp. ASW11-36]|uniref:MATE family efflux transporter n=1 Tax=Alteromonas arenosi TaxID=3055817 RepID=A0ABT7SV02_9ALTE|nr:MATE family efflux transporter [Alteromonas sp. ASW11-36]MDM7860016.1 MATE family efflux transporter [Alteromonas sp. ASW11-36]
MSADKQTNKRPDMLNGPIQFTLRKMTIPMIYGMIMLMTFGLVDTFFVSLLGTEQLAAISFTFPVTFTLISLNIGLGIGTSAIIGRYLGSGDHSHAKEFATGSLMLATIMVGALAVLGLMTIEPVFALLGASETLMPYIKDYMIVWYFAGVFLALPMVGNSVLRASGDTKTPSIIMAAGGGVNALLDPLLIFGWGPIPAMGIQGAAVATAIAWGIGVIWILTLLVKRHLMLPRLLSFQELRFTSGGILKIGLPAAGANMLTPIAGGVLTKIVSGYGAAAVAAWGVGNRLESIASIAVLALSMSLPPFISQNFGAEKLSRVRDAYSIAIRFVLIWQFGVFVVMWLLSPFIAAAFTQDPAVAKLIQLFLLIVPLGYGLQGIVILTNSSFNAMHKPMSALILSVIRLFVFLVPISLVGSLLYDLEGMFWGSVVANLLMGALSFFWFKRQLSREFSCLSEQLQ